MSHLNHLTRHLNDNFPMDDSSILTVNLDELSPVTPGSGIFDEEKFLVPYNVRPFANHNNNNNNHLGKKKQKWFSFEDIPFAIGIFSILQIFLHIYSNDRLRNLLRFEPRKHGELWRFFTYMLVHEDWSHLLLNIIMQCLFAYFLEKKHSPLRVAVLYLLSGMTGALGASCVHPDLVIGASAGAYGLLISHISDIALNYKSIKYKLCRIFSIIFIVLFDIAFNVIHFYSKDEPLISWVAHLVGGITGLFMGLVLYTSCSQFTQMSRLNFILFCLGLLCYMLLFTILVVMVYQIKKCTPANIIRIKYIYFC